MSGRPASPELRATLAAALALAILVVAFLWNGIARLGDGYYSSGDVSRAWSLTRTGGDGAPSNQLLSDPPLQFEIWRRLARDELAHGRLPLWNPWNAGGMPLFANLQSALLSPFTLPHWALPERAALLVAAFAKLFCAGLATFLLLRRLGAAAPAALVGGVVYAFAGHGVLLLAYPHSGVSALLPLVLLCVEIARARYAATGRIDRAVVARLALCALGVAACALAGHPEAFLFALALVAAFAAWRALSLGGSARRSLLCGYALSLVLGIALAGVQWVPFAEYVIESSAWERRASGGMALWSASWPLLFFPDLAGNPSPGPRFADGLPPPNYETANTLYCGSLALMLALLAIGAWRRQPAVRFFAVVVVVWALYAFDRAFGRAVMESALGRIAPPKRSQLALQLAVAALAAFALDGAVRSSPSRRRGLVWAAVAFVTLAAFAAQARVEVGQLARQLPALEQQVRDQAAAHATFVAVTFALGVALACAACASRSAGARAVGVGGVALVAFVQTGWLWRGYNPVCDERELHPRTESIAELQRLVGDDVVAILGADTLPPNENALHGLRMVSGYDALWNARYDRLARVTFGDESNWRITQRATLSDCVRFGVRWVLAPAQEAAEVDPELVRTAEIGGFQASEVPRWPGRFRCVARALAARDEADALERVIAGRIDPRHEAAIEGASEPELAALSAGLPPVVRIDRAFETPVRIELDVRLDRPACLVTALAWYPGWEVEVDGVERALLRADSCFLAVALPAGSSRVVFQYRPISLVLGAGLTAAAGLLALAMWRLAPSTGREGMAG